MSKSRKISRTERARLVLLAPDTPQRAARYGRLSLFVDATTSPERQTGECVETINRRRYVHDPKTDVYEDYESVSATSGAPRPAFDRLLANLDQYDVVVVYRLDRICRSVHQVVALLERLSKANCALVSATESWVDTSSEIGKAFIFLAVMFAAMEVEAMGERVANAQGHMLRNGRNRGGKRPYGFVPASSGETGGHVWAQVPAEVERILEAVAWVLAGKTMNSLCTKWTAEGVPTPKHAHTTKRGRIPAWHQPSLKAILTNPILLGHVVYGNDVVRDTASEPIELAPPILDPATFHRLQAEIERRDRGGARTIRNDSLFTGVARGECGETMHSGGATYRCAHHDMPKALRGDCPGIAITKTNLDAFALGFVADRLTADNLARAAEEASRLAVPAAPDRSAEKAAVVAAMDRLEQDRRAGMYDKPKAKARYRAQYAELVAELEAFDEPPPMVERLAGLLKGPISADWLLDKVANDITGAREFMAAVFDPAHGGDLTVRKGQRGRHQQVQDRVSIAVVRELRAPGR